eukprot:GHRR01026045.1.p1 GENE.GHRR01026045.1~~GHRR01026045.1.p1  ORF type:complete len:134 (-),score=41.11 GHRR01026045.1:538-939(-)
MSVLQVFALLDMHRTISGALPPLSSLLTDGASHQILADLARLQLVVASAAASLFTEYAESVARDSSKVLPLDGTIHPLTAQVLSYLKVCQARQDIGYCNKQSACHITHANAWCPWQQAFLLCLTMIWLPVCLQ